MRPPIVSFNEEIGWKATTKVTGPIQQGEPVYLHHIQSVEFVELPKHEGKRCAFVYLHSTLDGQFQIIFDFSPNQPGYHEDEGSTELRKAIADSLEAMMSGPTVHIAAAQQHKLSQVGLWPVPALLLHPLNKILHHLERDDAPAALSLLVSHCTPSFLEGLVAKWWGEPAFATRRNLIEDALDAHKQRKSALAIRALIPDVEGVISDWVVSRCPDMPFRQESKTERFRDLVLEGLPSTQVYNTILAAAIAFILEGPVLKSFAKWHQTISHAFPNRHVVGHGKYQDAHFSEENSIKLFLLLDTLFFLMQSTKGQAPPPAS